MELYNKTSTLESVKVIYSQALRQSAMEIEPLSKGVLPVIEMDLKCS